MTLLVFFVLFPDLPNTSTRCFFPSLREAQTCFLPMYAWCTTGDSQWIGVWFCWYTWQNESHSVDGQKVFLLPRVSDLHFNFAIIFRRLFSVLHLFSIVPGDHSHYTLPLYLLKPLSTKQDDVPKAFVRLRFALFFIRMLCARRCRTEYYDGNAGIGTGREWSATVGPTRPWHAGKIRLTIYTKIIKWKDIKIG